MGRIKRVSLIGLFSMLLCCFSMNVFAYVPIPSARPELTSFVFREQGQILHTGDTLHIEFTLSHDLGYIADVWVNNRNWGHDYRFDSNINKYTLEYKLDKQRDIEEKHTLYNINVGGYGFHSANTPLLSNCYFIYSDDCYYGRHRGGAATPSKQAVCSICETPYGDYAKGVTLNATKTTLQAGKTSTALKIEEKNPSDKVKKWTSSNPKVVSVHKKTGKLTAKKTGKATITVTMKSGATAKCKVTVKKSADKTKKLMIANVPKLKVGQKYQLIVRRSPVTATEKLTYEALGKDSGVSVNKKGLVKAKLKGSYIVEVKSSNGKRAKVRVNVF